HALRVHDGQLPSEFRAAMGISPRIRPVRRADAGAPPRRVPRSPRPVGTLPLLDLRRQSDRGHVPHPPGTRVHGKAELHISTLGSWTNSAVGLTSLIPGKDRVGLHFGSRVATMRRIVAIPRFLQVPSGSLSRSGPVGPRRDARPAHTSHPGRYVRFTN